MNSLDKNFTWTIVGGGTAGWLAALYIQKYYPETNITVIASSNIGILGAGEGTTPHFISFLEEIDISVVELIKNADATFKNGIKFTNWNGDGNHYYHPFKDLDDLDHTIFSDLNYSNIPLMDLELISEGKNLDSIDLSAYASENNKVRFYADTEIWRKEGDPYYFFKKLGLHALHFNANKLASYLEKVAIVRGINLVDATVIKIEHDNDGYIKKLKLDKGYTLDTNFVIDSTGFSRLFIGKHFNSKWKDYSEFLPVNRALPFFIPNKTSIIPPYTESIAMKAGWMWKIPVGDRFGCGYVFDSNCVTDDDAKLEIEKYIGRDIEVPKSFNFKAGCFETQWQKNCIAIGLSSGFIEPLEATSIWVSIQSLHCLLENISGVTHRNMRSIDSYNQQLAFVNQKVLEFVHFHYLSRRDDSRFWKNFNELKNPDFIKELKELSDSKIPKKSFFTNSYVFEHKSFYAVGAGIHFFNQHLAKEEFSALLQGTRYKYFQNFKKNYLKNLRINKVNLLDHFNFLNLLKDL